MPRTIRPLAALDDKLAARIHYDLRKAAGAAVIAIGCLIATTVIDGSSLTTGGLSWHARAAGYGCVAGFVVAGVLAVRFLANELTRVSTLRGSTAAAGPVRVLTLLAGYVIIVLTTLDLLGISLGHVLVGGAITGVVVGIAAQQSLGNFFAGLVLLFTRPYVPGEYVRVRSGALGGPLEGVVSSVSLLYTRLETAEGPINIPNSGLLAAAVGPVTPPTPARSER